jgi:hypothetical protein
MSGMKLLRVAIFCCSVIWLAVDSRDAGNTGTRQDLTGGNPMKVNVEQLHRIQTEPVNYANAG